MTPDSFTFNAIDMYQTFAVKILAYDLLMPELRRREVVIPGRSGAYDYGAKYHENRPLQMQVEVEREISPMQFDELKYTLSRKGRIILWDKPDRYFVGQLYDPAEVTDFFRHSRREFEIAFLCEPYAYALEPTVLKSTEPVLRIAYEGTREAPTLITIRNTGDTPLYGLRISSRSAR